MTGCDSI